MTTKSLMIELPPDLVGKIGRTRQNAKCTSCGGPIDEDGGCRC